MVGYLLLNLGLAAWMYWDGRRRMYPIIPWSLAAVPFGWAVLPVYLAKRPLREGEVREGGTAWNVLKNFCLFWTLTMAVAAVAGLGNVSSMPEAGSDAERAGRAIGAVIGLGMIFALWFFPLAGAALLGFFLKKSSVVERGPTGVLATMTKQEAETEGPAAAEIGVLTKAKRLAGQVGEYARSEEARQKIETVKKKAADVGGMATTGAKKLAEGTKQAAAQARVKADEFSKSERVQAIKSKAKGEWDEIRDGNFKGSRLSESPVIVGLAIFLFFPVGLYLLWKHPVLRGNKTWWWAGGVWSIFAILAVIGRNDERTASPQTQALGQNEPVGRSALDGGARASEALLDWPPDRITPEAVLAIVKPFDTSNIDYSEGPNGEPLVTGEGFDEDDKKPTTESGFVGPDGTFVLHGLRTTWFEAPSGRSAGRRLCEAFYFDGERHGIYREWRETGEKLIERTYRHGKNYGIGIWFYKNGTIGALDELEGDYKNGLSCKWHENGRIESVETIRTGIVNGKLTTRSVGRTRSWFADGSPNMEVSFNEKGHVHSHRIEHFPKGRPVETLWDDGQIVFDRATCNKRALHEYMKVKISTHDGDGTKFLVKSASEFFRRVGQPDPGSIEYNNYDSDDVPWGFHCTYRCSDGDLSVLVQSISGNVFVFVNPEDTLR